MRPTITKVGDTDVTNIKIGRRHFESVHELHEWLAEYDPRKDPESMSFANNKIRDSVKQSATQSWDLKAGWENAVEMSYTGWAEGGEKVTEKVDLITSSLPAAVGTAMSNGIDFEYQDEGDELCVESYLDGSDRYWHTPVFQREKPVVRVCVNIGASAGVDAQSIMARGIVVAAMVVKLERIGYGVQLFIGDAGRSSDQYYVSSVCIKQSNEYLHESGIAFWLAHPAALRRIGFRMIESAPAAIANMGCSYGMPQTFDSPDYDFISDEAHLDRARDEGWLNKPEVAAKAAVEMIERVIEERSMA